LLGRDFGCPIHAAFFAEWVGDFLFVIPAGNLLLFWLVILTLSEVEGEESPHLLMLLPVILAQPESPSLSVLLFVIPAGNLLLSLPVFVRHSELCSESQSLPLPVLNLQLTT